MADDAAPAPEPQAPVDTPYRATNPDGSTSTYVLHSNRTPSPAEVAGYAASQGHQFAGIVEAPSPEAPPAAEPAAPTAWQRTKDVLFPSRNLLTQAPSIAGAIQGGTWGAGIGAMAPPPFDLVTIPAGGIVGAALGGGGGEALQYGAEKLFGFQPAEPGTLAQRVGSATVRGGVGEVVGLPLRAGAQVAYRAIRPAAETAAALEPVLTGTAETAVPVGAGAAEALTPKYLLPQWWQANAAGKSPQAILEAWGQHTAEEQARIAGDQLPVVQNYMAQLAKGAVPWSQSVGRLGWGGAVQAPAWIASGHPNIAVGSVLPLARDVVTEGFNKGVSSLLASPGGSEWLAGLPGTADVAGPMFNFSTRWAGQPLVARKWPAAEDLMQ